MTRPLHVKERRGVIRILENKRRGEVDRRCTRAGCRVGRRTGMQGEGVEAGVFWGWHGSKFNRPKEAFSVRRAGCAAKRMVARAKKAEALRDKHFSMPKCSTNWQNALIREVGELAAAD